MNIEESFAKYLQDNGIATLGHDLFIGEAPNSNIAEDSLFWIVENGGAPIKSNSTGEMMKNYQIQVFYRNRDYQTVKDRMFGLEEFINHDTCTQLTGYDTVDILATGFPIDSDIDDEERKIGMLQVEITIYRDCATVIS